MKLPRERQLRITAIASVGILCLIVVTASLIKGPESPLFRFPTQSVLPPPAFATEETFECWAAPPSQPGSVEENGFARLLIAFNDASGLALKLYSFNLVTAEHALLASDMQDYGVPGALPPVSPDGRYFWYGIYKSASDDVIFVHDLVDGTAHQVAFPAQVSTPQDAIGWSADSQCLFLWQGNTAMAYRVADGAIQQKIFPGKNFAQVSASPDGQWWAWGCAESICLMSPEGQQIEDKSLSLSSQVSGRGESIRIGLIRWSHDGMTLAFAYGITPPHAVYFDTVRLIDLESDRIIARQDIPLPSVSIASLSWSPDDRYLLIADSRLDEKSLRVYDTTAGTVATMPQPQRYGSVAPVWSPDGKQIAFTSEDDRTLYAMNADGTGLLTLPLPANIDGLPPAPHIQRVFRAP